MPARPGEATPQRLLLKVIVDQPAGPTNRYTVELRSGAVTLAGLDLDRPRSLLERGHLAGTRGDDGRPLRALVPVRLPTFTGCVIPAHPIGVVRLPPDQLPVVIAVPAVDPALAGITAMDGLPSDIDAAVREHMDGATVGNAAAAEAIVRAAMEADRRARAEAERGARTRLAWKVSDAHPPVIDGRPAMPHTFAEQAVPLLPARFQEYIARALLPEERILLFIHRPPLVKATGFGLRRSKRREGIFVLTDRQVMSMFDSLDPDNLMVHWGYIARVTAVERVSGAVVRSSGDRVTLDITCASAGGAETLSFEFPADLGAAVEDTATLVGAFVPQPGTRALRRCYPRRAPDDLPSLAEVHGRGEAPVWARALLADEPLLAWAQAPAERGQPATLVVGERSVAWDGAARGTVARGRCGIDEVTSLELALTLVASHLEVAVGDGETVRRVRLRFHYPAAAPFLGAFTVIRHLMGLPPEVERHARTTRS